MTLIERAPNLQAAGLDEPYKLLADFNGAVLACHPSRYGAEFVTWEWAYGRTRLWQGHYYGPGGGAKGYRSAKEDFCIRSGLMDHRRLFTNEQLAEVYRCVHETLESTYTMTPERQKLLEGVADQIEHAVPDLAEQVSRYNEREMEAMAEKERPDMMLETPPSFRIQRGGKSRGKAAAAGGGKQKASNGERFLKKMERT